MVLTCPKCGKTNTNDIIEINYEKELYICYFCKNEFHEQDSLDYDWDLMHQRFKENITENYLEVLKNNMKKILISDVTVLSQHFFNILVFGTTIVRMMI
jgi:hypothetical protein